MPWQQQIADVGLEFEMVDGIIVPFYREVVVTVPRQNGKTTLTLGWEFQRAVGWRTPQAIAYTAQTGKDAREKLVNDQFPLLDPRMPPRLSAKSLVKRVTRGIGNESVEFKSGSRIFILYSGEESGHGKTLDLGVIDESFADVDDRREQAMVPAMNTRPSAQILNISTAGTDKSPFLRRKVDAGRAAVADDRRSGIAYFEWSAPEDAPYDDPATWWACMPALGYTITEEVIAHACQSLPEGEFRRAYLNQWTISEERVIPAALWDRVCRPTVRPDGRLVFAVDVNPERSATSVAVADAEGRVELLEHAPGVAWAVPYLVERAKKWEGDVVVDQYGPAGNLIDELEDAEIDVHRYDTPMMSRACADLYDAVADDRIKIRRHKALDLAAAAARRRQTGDTWTWGRRGPTEDISPLIAVTLAYDKAAEPGGDPFFSFG
jgi:hypothetical protein